MTHPQSDNTYRVEVHQREPSADSRGLALQRDAQAAGVAGIETITVADVYHLYGSLDRPSAQRIAEVLLADPVLHQAVVLSLPEEQAESAPVNALWIEVAPLPGVTDPVAESLVAAAQTVGVSGLARASTATRYHVTGSLGEAEAHLLALRVLSNPVIQHYTIGAIAPDHALGASASGHHVENVRLAGLDDAALMRTSVERVLSLNLEEMHAVRDYFEREGRDPTDVELETLAQTWSEHCVHKTFRATIDYTEVSADGVHQERVRNILRTYLAAATTEVAKPWVLSAFVDNAGVIDFDDETEVSFKVETHNHPSALEPFGGANTGVGGVVRDVIGVSARPIANTNILCFGYQDRAFEDLPEGVLHPRRILSGVVAGIKDYGNKMGIPTVNGAVLFDDGYLANPLVFCGCVGIAPKGRRPVGASTGEAVVMLGGRIGRDGLHGATFSSVELAHDTGETVGTVVQIGNPITEKKVLEAVMVARDRQLYSAITDCGAGGLSSAVGEMGEATGVSVELADAPLKYPGLAPWEIWVSEAQERMVLAVPQENVAEMQEVCASLDVEMTVIGTFTDDRRLTVKHHGVVVADLDMAFLHDGIPTRHLQAEWHEPVRELEPPQLPADLSSILLRILSAPNVASKADIIQRYDYEVQGATVGKPLAGPEEGPGDAAVLRSSYAAERWRGLALGCGINPRYGAIDPYAMAWAAIDEAMRNVVAVGGDPDRVAILDNFCWGNPNLPDRLGALVRAAKGCHDGAVSFGTPFISGKDSLFNEYTDGTTGQRISIPHTLLISALAIVPDVRQAVTMDLKEAGNLLYIVGETRDELGGSHYGLVTGEDWGRVPQPVEDGLDIARALHGAITGGLVRSAHDCSEGGIAVATAEMALAGGLGLELDLRRLPGEAGALRTDLALFSESSSRYLIEVEPGHAEAFEAAMASSPHARLGAVTADPRLVVTGTTGETAVDIGLEAIGSAWRDQTYDRP